jgi:hypothetical protein
MTEASLALQSAVRARLVAAPSVLGLVPADQIFDRSTRPEVFPCVILGDGHTVHEGTTYSRRTVRVFADVHVWQHGDALADVKGLSGAVEAALRGGSFPMDDFRCVDLAVTGTRFMRDPGNKHVHAVVSVEALLEEVL